MSNTRRQDSARLDAARTVHIPREPSVEYFHLTEVLAFELLGADTGPILSNKQCCTAFGVALWLGTQEGNKVRLGWPFQLCSQLFSR
jgi:hypothetical protein